MSEYRQRRRPNLVVAQVVGALAVLALIALAPPAQGTILLIPVTGLAQGQIAAIALMHGASLMQRGPLPRSIIVYGDRGKLFGPLTHAGVVMVAGGVVGCNALTENASL